MAEQTLATKYRPTTFDDVVGQESVKIILEQQLKTKTTKNAYLFCGGAGTGKTTCARIFANELNNHIGNPIEMDAASNSGVDDVRQVIQQAKLRPIDSEYKIFIIDECHSISNTGWQAFLKLLEEPPRQSVFIFCTTDPQKIPKTILSRVQRYDFQRISQQGIVDRLIYILTKEQELGHEEKDAILYDDDALEYIAKIADGGMRDAITMLDQCLAYSTRLTVENVLEVLGTADIYDMVALTGYIVKDKDMEKALSTIERIYADGKDLKQFIKQYIRFLLDVSKYNIGVNWTYMSLPKTNDIEKALDDLSQYVDDCFSLLDSMLKLDSNIRYSQTVKYDVEATIVMEMIK